MKKFFLQIKTQFESILKIQKDATRNIINHKEATIQKMATYVEFIYNEIKKIDATSSIKLYGKMRKLMRLTLPEIVTSIEKQISIFFDETAEAIKDNYENTNEFDRVIRKQITTWNLLSSVINVDFVKLELYKIERETGNSRYRTWEEVVIENSGAEKFISMFTFFISMTTYMRQDDLNPSFKETRVLLMDNPFGVITTDTLLKPFFDIAKKHNTQLICFTDIVQSAVVIEFDNIYRFSVVELAEKKKEKLKFEIVKGVTEELDKSYYQESIL